MNENSSCTEELLPAQTLGVLVARDSRRVKVFDDFKALLSVTSVADPKSMIFAAGTQLELHVGSSLTAMFSGLIS